jgi:diketogulonate reductase-like aldo/keto reductase
LPTEQKLSGVPVARDALGVARPPGLAARFDLTQQAYRALEVLLGDGRVRAIGVSNFMPRHLENLLKEATVVPAVNQVEVHPYFTQPAVQAADAARGVITQA